MKKKTFYIFLFLVLGTFILSSCQEKIYGQTKRKRKRNCGCELIKTPPQTDAYAYKDSSK